MEQPAMESPSRTPLLIVIVALAVAVAVLAGWWIGRSTSQTESAEAEPAAPTQQVPLEAEPLPERLVAPLPERWSEAFEEALAWSSESPSGDACAAVDAQLEEACSESGFPCELAQSAALALARRPPVASGELYKHETVLANTFHLFRVLGRRDLTRLRDAARGTEVDRELLALAFYRWLATREVCGEGDEKALTLSVLNDYAVYGLSTLGGQAYLRRRAPEVEGIATFYGLLTVDRAIAAGKDAHGLDPRPFVTRAEGLLDDRELALRDEYAAALADFKTRWGGF